MIYSLENLKEYSVPLEQYVARHFFTDENDNLASKEHQDQIFVLNPEAAKFLWEYNITTRLAVSDKYYKNTLTFNASFLKEKEIKKFLFNLGIPFNKEVFISTQPQFGFVLTWKMVIKYSHNLFFAYDQIVWDASRNWQLEFHHDGEFTFGKSLIFNGQNQYLKNIEMIAKALEEMDLRKNNG